MRKDTVEFCVCCGLDGGVGLADGCVGGGKGCEGALGGRSVVAEPGGGVALTIVVGRHDCKAWVSGFFAGSELVFLDVEVELIQRQRQIPSVEYEKELLKI